MSGAGTAAAALALALLPPSPALSPDGLPAAWRPHSFKRIERRTRWEWSAPESALHAVSSASASGLIYRLDDAAEGRTVLRWRWKVSSSVAEADESRREGDDCAARVYALFSPGFVWRTRAVVYVWARRMKPGESRPNAYTGRAMMLALRSGDAEAGKWVSEERDLASDYRRLFGGEPPRLSAIAVMTDTDDTGSIAEAWYSGIELSSRR